MECLMNSRSAKLENWTVQTRYPLYPGYIPLMPASHPRPSLFQACPFETPTKRCMNAASEVMES